MQFYLRLAIVFLMSLCGILGKGSSELRFPISAGLGPLGRTLTVGALLQLLGDGVLRWSQLHAT